MTTMRILTESQGLIKQDDFKRVASAAPSTDRETGKVERLRECRELTGKRRVGVFADEDHTAVTALGQPRIERQSPYHRELRRRWQTAARSPCGISGRTEWQPSQLKPTMFSIRPITVVEDSNAISNADADARTEISEGCVTIIVPLKGAISRDPEELFETRSGD